MGVPNKLIRLKHRQIKANRLKLEFRQMIERRILKLEVKGPSIELVATSQGNEVDVELCAVDDSRLRIVIYLDLTTDVINQNVVVPRRHTCFIE